MFVSEASLDTVQDYGLKKRIEPVKDCREVNIKDKTGVITGREKLGKKHMKFNSVTPKMEVDPETYVSPSHHVPDPASSLTIFNSLDRESDG